MLPHLVGPRVPYELNDFARLVGEFVEVQRPHLRHMGPQGSVNAATLDAQHHTQVDASPFRVWRRAVRTHLIRIDRKDGRDLLQLSLLSLFPLFGFYLSSQSFLGSQAGRIFCVLLSV
eukprot:FR736328.1.p1 GENE.FR736328.1~~FR736328.1.p1  ORF type:complete len:118 (-),score=5.61 FR736328.1:52-405(-)